MPRAPILALSACLLCTHGAATQVRAQDASPEVTLLYGLREGATLAPESVGELKVEADPAASWGLVLDFPVRPDGRVEVFYDRQELEFETSPAFDLTVDYLHAGGVYEPRRGKLRPFVAAALGLTRFDADGASGDDALELSGSLGGGVKVPLGSRLALRFEARAYATFSDVSFAVSCGPGCTASVGADGWYQLAGRIGLAIRL